MTNEIIYKENLYRTLYVNDENIAFNLYVFGNYMWGGAMNILGFSKFWTKQYVCWHECVEHRHWDSEADQRAIDYGFDSQ